MKFVRLENTIYNAELIKLINLNDCSVIVEYELDECNNTHKHTFKNRELAIHFFEMMLDQLGI